MLKKRIHRSKVYKAWYKSLSEKDKGIVDTRIDAYKIHDELINVKLLDSNFGLFEFKWVSGMRVYFSFVEDRDGKLMLLLLGGNKNSQASDIVKAKKIVISAVESIRKKRSTKKTTKKIVRKEKKRR